MKVSYDKATDTVYIKMKASKVKKTKEIIGFLEKFHSLKLKGIKKFLGRLRAFKFLRPPIFLIREKCTLAVDTRC